MTDNERILEWVGAKLCRCYRCHASGNTLWQTTDGNVWFPSSLNMNFYAKYVWPKLRYYELWNSERYNQHYALVGSKEGDSRNAYADTPEEAMKIALLQLIGGE